MDYLNATIYGIIQGLTEFLPVSSSGHLALLPHYLNITDPGVLFDLAMHVGTALAVLIYFRKDVGVLLQELLAFILRKDSPKGKRSFFVNYSIATLMTVLLAVPLKDVAPAIGRNPSFIAANLCVFGVLMFLADHFMDQESEEVMSKEINWTKSIFIGFFQAMALFPGVSRSGATLTISRFLNMSRSEAATFSFLLSLPLIFGGFILKLKDFSHSPDHGGWMVALWGMFVSFVVGIITIHYFLIFIKKLGLWIFAIYRIILAGIIYFSLS